MLKYRIEAGDTKLENRLKTSTSKATYISYTIQHELIEVYRKEITTHILKEIYHYGHNINEEDDPIPTNIEPKLTGNILGSSIINIISELGMNINNYIGIATDGCAVMISTVKGAVKKIQETAKNALYSPRNNHALNLSLSKCSTVQSVRNSVGIIQQIVSFFTSSKRHYVLKNILKGRNIFISVWNTLG